MKRRLTLVLAALSASLIAGCSTPERVILLPQADGRPSAVIAQHVAEPSRPGLVLAEPYAEARADGAQLQLGKTDAASVQHDFGPLMDYQPSRARLFTVNFLSNSDELTPDTAPVLEEVRKSLARMAAGELVVIGHTDSVGHAETNDALSLQRAEVVAQLLVKMGVAREKIDTVGRGEREPLVPTADETDEPRNRRVEIKLR